MVSVVSSITTRNMSVNIWNTFFRVSFVDSTPLRVYRNQRILIHKTFDGLAERGKCLWDGSSDSSCI